MSKPDKRPESRQRAIFTAVSAMASGFAVTQLAFIIAGVKLGAPNVAALALAASAWPLGALAGFWRAALLEDQIRRMTTTAAPDRNAFLVPGELSLKCRLYGERPHSPCSGTTDDGFEKPCLHWCHR